MAIHITGSNYGIAVDGNLSIEKIEFALGQGVRSVSGVAADTAQRGEPVPAATAELEPLAEAGHGSVATHPEVTPEQRRFFREKLWIEAAAVAGKATKRAIELPAEWMLRTIHDITTADGGWYPQQKTAAHRWKILYELLRRERYIEVGQRQRYAEFVKSVVDYCYPGVRKSYANNLSKSGLAPSMGDWSLDDKQLYRQLKAALAVEPK